MTTGSSQGRTIWPPAGSPSLTFAPIASVGSNFVPLLEAVTTLCHHAKLGDHPKGIFTNTNFDLVSRFLETAYTTVLEEWRAVFLESNLGDAIDQYIPWPRKSHTDLLSLGKSVADSEGTGQEAFLCSALTSSVYTATQTAIVLLFAQDLQARLKGSSNTSKGFLAGYCGGAALAIVLTFASNLQELFEFAVQNIRLGFWVGLTSDRAAARQRKSVGLQLQAATIRSWALVTMNVSNAVIEEEMKIVNDGLPQKHRAYISARAAGDMYTIMGLPTTLSIIESGLKRRIQGIEETAKSNKGRVSRLPIYGPFHSQVLLDSEMEAFHTAVNQRLIFADTPLSAGQNVAEPLANFISSSTGKEDSVASGMVAALDEMIFSHASRWDKVVETFAERALDFVKAQPKGVVEVINVGPGGSLGHSIAQQLRASGVMTQVVDFEECILKTAKRVSESPLPPLNSIAVVATAVRAPGGADSIDKFWNRLEAGALAPVKLPLYRFRVDDYITEARVKDAKSVHSAATYGYFLSDIDKFDARLFNISPREAERLDPHHRLMLECSMEALERAGYAPGATPSFDPERIGTFFAYTNDDYRDNGGVDIRSFHLTGNGRAFAAGRVSFLNRWKGPSATFDAGEMSVLTALMAATDSLRSKKCDTAVVAGANVILSPTMYIALDQAGLLAHTGSRIIPPFSDEVQGAVRGEACGVIILKRVETALEENDDILALISGLAQTFSPVSWTSPYKESEGQEDKDHKMEQQTGTRIEALRNALTKAQISPQSISAVECNCSGNAKDEEIEVRAISSVFSDPTSPLWLTTTKSAFGDAEGAAGILAMIKAIETVRREQIPPHAPLKTMNGIIKDRGASLAINSGEKCERLLHTDAPDARSALVVNSYSIGGGNAVAVVESAKRLLKMRQRKMSSAHSRVSPATHILLISANSKQALTRRLRDMADRMESLRIPRLQDLAYSLACRKIHYPLRVAVTIPNTASSPEEIATRLRTVSDIPSTATTPPELVIFFSGQGSQYTQMAAAISSASSVFRSILEDAEKFLLKHDFEPFYAKLRAGEELNDEATQIAIFCIDFALYQLLRHFGICASAFAGHSLGEYCALACAGVITIETALLLVASRARLVVKKCKAGAFGMIAVRCDSKKCAQLIEATKSPCEIACDNSKEAVTISGETSSLDVLQKAFEEEKIKATKLGVNFAFHSRAMDVILADYSSLAEKADFKAPHTAVYSNVLGRVVTAGEDDVFNGSYLVSHAREQVRFRQALEDAQRLRQSKASEGQRRRGLPPQIAIEAGADPIIMPMLRDVKSHDGKDAAFAKSLPCLKKRQDDVEVLSSTMSQLWLANCTVKWKDVYDELYGACNHIPDLPTYPFEDTRFFTPFTDRGLIKVDEEVYVSDIKDATVVKGSSMDRQIGGVNHQGVSTSFVQNVSIDHGDQNTVALFRVIQDEYFVAMARNHCVGDTALTPGTLTGVVCQQAAVQTLAMMGCSEEDSLLQCRAMHLPGPLPMPQQPDRDLYVRCTVFKRGANSGTEHDLQQYTVACALSSERQTPDNSTKATALHNEITLETLTASNLDREFSLLEPILLPSLRAIEEDNECEVLEASLAYKLFGRCVIYGEPYQAMRYIRMKSDIGMARVSLGRGRHVSGYKTVDTLPDSLTIDAIGQLPGLMCNLLSEELDQDHVFILDSCGRTAFLPRLKELERDCAEVIVLGTSRIEPRESDSKADVFAVADTFTFEQTERGLSLVAIMLGSRYHKMRTRNLLSVLKTVA